MNPQEQTWNSQHEGFGLSEDIQLTSMGINVPEAKPTISPSALQMASMAGKGIVRGIGVVSDFAANNSWGLRVISFGISLSFIVLACLGLSGIVGAQKGGRPGSFYLFNGYMVLLASIAFVAECKDEWHGFGVRLS